MSSSPARPHPEAPYRQPADEVLAERPDRTFADLVRSLHDRARTGGDEQRGVTLASLHAAKGLEWDAVLITGVHEGSVPLGRASKSPAAPLRMASAAIGTHAPTLGPRSASHNAVAALATTTLRAGPSWPLRMPRMRSALWRGPET